MRYSCFRATPLGAGLDGGSVIGVVGGEWAGGVHQTCPAQALSVGSQPPPPPPQAGKPFGHLDTLSGGRPGFIQVRGWTIDPDAPTAPTSIHVYADGPAGSGTYIGARPANVLRPDVGAVHPGTGSSHGFSAAFAGISPGSHSVYVYAINIAGPDGNPLIGSGTVNVPAAVAGSPFGHIDATEGRLGGKARVAGWTVDADSRSTPTSVHVYVDGPAGSGTRGVNLGQASLARPDVGARHGGGDRHGFDTVVGQLAPGNHVLWFYAIDVNGGENVLVNAQPVTVPLGDEPPAPPDPISPSAPPIGGTTAPSDPSTPNGPSSPTVGSPAPIAGAQPRQGVSRRGTAGANSLVGTRFDDRLTGRGGSDVLRGLTGSDLLDGGPGNDRLLGGPGPDGLIGGSGRDVLDAGTGNDSIDARDGAFDIVDCGPGRDRARADRLDRLVGCEAVRRA